MRGDGGYFNFANYFGEEEAEAYYKMFFSWLRAEPRKSIFEPINFWVSVDKDELDKYETMMEMALELYKTRKKK